MSAQQMSVALALAILVTMAFAVGHVPFIAGMPDGIDSANFTLAVDRYDPRLHQPHPPGFPLHVALGRFVNSAYEAVSAATRGTDGGTAAALRIWSVIAGALSVLSLTWIAAALGASPTRAVLAAALAATCPLFWITAMRPLSDVPGLCFAMLSQALALAAYNGGVRHRSDAAGRGEADAGSRANYRLLAAALVAGLAVGVRVQTALLTLPLLALVTRMEIRRGASSLMAQVPIAFACGMLVWAVPMMNAVGGPSAYLQLVNAVAADDVSGVEMLMTNPNLRLLALALLRTFIVPWNSVLLGTCVFGLAALGAIAMARHNRRALGIVTVMGLPYLVFHLLFQESASIRYALPVIPVLALLIVANLSMRATPVAVTVATVLLVSASVLSASAASAYGEDESPVARAVRDIQREAATRPRLPTLAFHHAVGRAIRGEVWPGTVLSGQVRYEWLELARYWLAGGSEPVWFLSDDRRADLALIDPAARRQVRSYRWPGNVASLLGGIQPVGVTWHEIAAPGWFLMRGWSVAADAHGLTTRDGRSPGRTGIVGHVRRRDAGAVMMIGGRNTGDPADAGASVELSIDGRPRAAWVVSSQSSFLQVIALAPGELRGEGAYATVDIRAWDVAGTARVITLAVEHFDVQSPGGALAGIGRGWHIPELDTTGVSWRWTDESAELRLEGFGRDVELVIRGESPLRYFQTPPRVVVNAGQVELASFRPSSDFEWVVPVPASILARNSGRVTIESDRWFIPDELHGNGDQRRLALRIYSVQARHQPSSADSIATPRSGGMLGR